jgi:REP-associated tyrosine transposase
MPRAARIDLLNTLNHVMVRGIERTDIFLDDADRSAFLHRLASLLNETGTECLAWAIMRNHVHLLLRPRQGKLSTFMRRLLTGYAVTFNRRHHRSGHLFQNRYKSIVCEEDAYLLELVRYIHLNPLRVGAVGDMGALDRYPWTGHSVLMGQNRLAEQNCKEILAYFGKQTTPAREGYRRFIVDGAGQGKREEFCGGGLRRVLRSGGDVDPSIYDERVLGSSEFVQRVIGDADVVPPDTEVLPLPVLVQRVGAALGITAEKIRGPGRSKAVTAARSLISYLGYRKMGHGGEAIAKALGITRSGVCRRSVAGEELFQSDARWQGLIF